MASSSVMFTRPYKSAPSRLNPLLPRTLTRTIKSEGWGLDTDEEPWPLNVFWGQRVGESSPPAATTTTTTGATTQTHGVLIRHPDGCPERYRHSFSHDTFPHALATLMTLVDDLSKPMAHMARLRAALCHVGSNRGLPCHQARANLFPGDRAPLLRRKLLPPAQGTRVQVGVDTTLAVTNGAHALAPILSSHKVSASR